MKKIILLLFLLIPINTNAFERTTNFEFDVFEKAQKDGKIIVVNSWNKSCGTCAKQIQILAQAEKEFDDVVFLSYEQTEYKDIAQYLNIDFWATIVVYKGNKEVSKVLGVTNKDEIYSLIEKNS